MDTCRKNHKQMTMESCNMNIKSLPNQVVFFNDHVFWFPKAQKEHIGKFNNVSLDHTRFKVVYRKI